MGQEDRDALEQRFAKYAKHGSKFDKAIETVLAHGVKEHRFLPSGRTIHTVVGNLGDEFIDPGRPYCSCSHFFFRVLGHRDELCYHLLGFMMASESERVDVITFSDEEYNSVLAAIVGDVFYVLDRSSR